jgi:hypothetical protein
MDSCSISIPAATIDKLALEQLVLAGMVWSCARDNASPSAPDVLVGMDVAVRPSVHTGWVILGGRVCEFPF